MPRLFIGWPVPELARREIAEALRPLRSSLPPVSWLKHETYHVTFSFLGEQPETAVSEVSNSLNEALDDVRSEKVCIMAPGFFPSGRRPRIGWLDVRPSDRMTEAARKVGAALASVRIDTDQKAFRPHLTVVRTRDRWSIANADHFVERLRDFRTTVCEFDRVVLFESELTARGAFHSVLHRVDLRAPNV